MAVVEFPLPDEPQPVFVAAARAAANPKAVFDLIVLSPTSRMVTPMMQRTNKNMMIAVSALVLLGGCGSSGGSDNASTSGSTSADAPTPESTGPSALAPVHGAYSPQIDPANFVSAVDNRYLPYKPGMRWHFTGVAENGTTPQVDDEFVTDKTKRILGVDCTVVRDTVTSRGKPVERTFDWYAQDKQGNVWYFGEDARDYKHGQFIKASDSWISGVDGAQPGIAMPADPQPGDAYRQEYYPKHAEDQALVLKGAPAVKVPYASFRQSLTTVERTATEPGVRERKYYALGVGEIKEEVVRGSREQIQLVGFSR